MSAIAEQSAAPKWVRTTLGAVTEEKVSQMGPQGPTEFVYVDISSIDNKTKRVVEPKTLPVGHAPSRAKQNLRAGDVLVSMTRPNLNAVALVPPELDGAVGSTGFHVLRARQAEPSWLFYSIQTHDFIDAMCRLVQGALYPAVRPKDIRAYPVPIPPLDEQRRIVAEIEKQFTRLEAGVAGLRRVQANLKRYRAAVLKATVEGKLTEEWRKEHPEVEAASELLKRILSERRTKWNGRGRYKEPLAPDIASLPTLPERWTWTRLEQLGFVFGGLTKNPQRAKLAKRLPYLRVANVYANELRLDEIEEIGVEEDEMEKLLLQPGDLLVVEGNGSKDQIGRLAIWDGSISPCVHQNHIIKVRLVNVGLGQWVLLWLLSLPGRHFVEQVASSTSGLYTLSVNKVGALPIPLPPLAEEDEMVAEVERRMSVFDDLVSAASANLQRAERLRQSILRRAFSGRFLHTGGFVSSNDSPVTSGSM